MITEPMELLKALQQTNERVQVTEELYCLFMATLPSVSTGSNHFVCQESEGEKMLFVESQEQYFCYLLSDFLVTNDGEISAHVVRSKLTNLFKVNFIYDDTESCNVPEDLAQFVGMEFSTVSQLAESMNVTFSV